MFSYLDVQENDFEFSKWNYVTILFLNLLELPDLSNPRTI